MESQTAMKGWPARVAFASGVFAQQPWSENHFDVDQDGSMSLEPS